MNNEKKEKNAKATIGVFANVAQLQFETAITYLFRRMYGEDSKVENISSAINYIFGIKAIKKVANIDVLRLAEEHFTFLTAVRAFQERQLELKDKQEKEGLSSNDSKKVEEICLVDSYKNILLQTYNLLSNLRNYHTHYYHKQLNYKGVYNINLGKRSLLNFIYDNAIRELNKRFNPSETNLKSLSRYTTDENDKTILKEVKELPKYFALDHDLESNENKVFGCSGEFKKGLTDNGIIFFINLFLSKEYSSLFLSQTTGLKKSEDEHYRMTRELYSIYSMKLPKEKVNWTTNRFTIVLDALNELSKVPNGLRKRISPDDFKCYLRDWGELETTNKYNNAKDENENEYSLSTSVRYRNRFEEFALSLLPFLEKQFENVYFYTYLGKVYKKHYIKKELIDGSSDYDRYISESLCGFTNSKNKVLLPNELENVINSGISQRIPVYKSNDNIEHSLDEDFVPYVSYAYPHYIINNGKIGIFINTSKEKYDNVYPTLSFENGKLKQNIKPMTCWISIRDIPVLLYLVCSGYFKKKKFLPLVYGSLKKIEKKNQSKGRTASQRDELIKNRLKKYIEDAKRQKEIKTYSSGKLASILVKDILWIQPSKDNEGKDKLTGPNAQALQRSFAYYSSYKKNIEGYLKNCSNKGIAPLIRTANSHPFIEKILNKKPTTLRGFYNLYFKHKISFLEGLLANYGKEVKESDYYIVRKLLKPIHTEEEDRKLCDNFVFTLKRDVLMNELREFLEIKIENNKFHEQKIEDYKPSLAEILNHNKIGVQDFYLDKRAYRFTSGDSPEYLTLEERKNKIEQSNIKKKACRSEEEKNEKQLYKSMVRSECLINELQTQDKVLFEALKNIDEFKTILENASLGNLNIKRDTKNEKLNSQTQVRRLKDSFWSKTCKFDVEINLSQDSKNNALYLKRKGNEELIDNSKKDVADKRNRITISNEDFKLKDYGKFKLLLSSKKFKSMLNFYLLRKPELNKKPSYELLKNEYTRFEKERYIILNKSQELEYYLNPYIKAKYLGTTDKESLCYKFAQVASTLSALFEENGYYNFNEIICQLTLVFDNLNTSDKNLIAIRNNYFHSEYNFKVSEAGNDDTIDSSQKKNKQAISILETSDYKSFEEEIKKKTAEKKEPDESDSLKCETLALSKPIKDYYVNRIDDIILRLKEYAPSILDHSIPPMNRI